MIGASLITHLTHLVNALLVQCERLLVPKLLPAFARGVTLPCLLEHVPRMVR